VATKTHNAICVSKRFADCEAPLNAVFLIDEICDAQRAHMGQGELDIVNEVDYIHPKRTGWRVSPAVHFGFARLAPQSALPRRKCREDLRQLI
jgi:hypothetical protein